LRRLGLALAETSAAGARDAAERAGLLDGVPTIDLLQRVPLLRKEALPAYQAGAPPLAGWGAWERVRKLFASPGPIYEPEGAGPDPWGCAPAMHAAGFRAGDVVLNSFSYHMSPAGSIMEGGALALGAIVIPGGVGNTELQCRAAAHLRATGYVGTPSFLAILLEKAGDLAIDLCLEVALVSAEPLPESLRLHFASRGVRAQQAYATADAGVIAYECPFAEGLHLADRCIVELVDPETGAGRTGGTGRDRRHPARSYLSAAAPCDGGSFGAGPRACRCGRTAPRLHGILGRTGDAVKVRGLFVHPSALRSAMARHPEAHRYQFVVRRDGNLDELVARVEAERPDATLAERVAAAVKDVTRLRVVMELVAPGTLADARPVLVDERHWS